MAIDLIKIFLPSIIAFLIGLLITPRLTNWLYRKEMWKKKAKTMSFNGETPIFNKLHGEREVSVPRLGGIVIWASVLFTTILFWILARIFPTELLQKLDFLSRSQTWIPLFAMLIGAFVGIIDDILDIRGKVGDYIAGGLSLKKRLLVVGVLSLLISLWFYFKLDVASIGMPFVGELYIGWFFIPLFILVALAIYSGGIIDGLDGLAGGIFASIFSAYAVIAFFQDQINLATFCLVIVGGILAFLWFNIPPARFYMSETGSMALTIALAIVAFMTDSLGDGHGLIVLPLIAFPLVITTLSVIIQTLSKKLRAGKKVFLVAPLHHHFEAIGWPAYKVTMRYWIVGLFCSILGLILALL